MRGKEITNKAKSAERKFCKLNDRDGKRYRNRAVLGNNASLELHVYLTNTYWLLFLCVWNTKINLRFPPAVGNYAGCLVPRQVLRYWKKSSQQLEGILVLANAKFELTIPLCQHSCLLFFLFISFFFLFFSFLIIVEKAGNSVLGHTTTLPHQGTDYPGKGSGNVLEWKKPRACFTGKKKMISDVFHRPGHSTRR